MADGTNINVSLTDQFGGTTQDTKITSNSIEDVRDILDRLNRVEDMDFDPMGDMSAYGAEEPELGMPDTMEPEMGMDEPEDDLNNMGNTGLGGMDDMSMGLGGMDDAEMGMDEPEMGMEPDMGMEPEMDMGEPEMEPTIVPGSDVMDMEPVDAEDHMPYGDEGPVDMSEPTEEPTDEPIDVSIEDDGTLSLDKEIDEMFSKFGDYKRGNKPNKPPLDKKAVQQFVANAIRWTGNPAGVVVDAVEKFGEEARDIAQHIANASTKKTIDRGQRFNDSIQKFNTMMSLNENFGSSNSTDAVRSMNDYIQKHENNRRSPHAIMSAAEGIAPSFANHIGMSQEEAVDWLIGIYTKREMGDTIHDMTTSPEISDMNPDMMMPTMEEGIADFAKRAYDKVKPVFPIHFKMKGINGVKEFDVDDAYNLDQLLANYGFGHAKKKIMQAIRGGETWSNGGISFSPVKGQNLKPVEENAFDTADQGRARQFKVGMKVTPKETDADRGNRDAFEMDKPTFTITRVNHRKEAILAKNDAPGQSPKPVSFGMDEVDLVGVNEDADFDYRDKDAGPTDPNEYNRETDIADFAKKGHAKKQMMRGGRGDNILPEEDEVFESKIANDWKAYKAK